MRALLTALAVSVLLAGCSGSEPDSGEDQGLDAGAETTTTDAVPPPAAPIPDEVVVVAFDGNTGTYAYAFETTTGQGGGHDVVAGENGFIVERPGMMLVAADLTLTWTAANPSSQTLTFDLMVMGPNSTQVASVTGPTGLNMAQQGLAFPLDSETVVHFYFYNPTVFVHNPPVVAGGAVDQVAHVEGTLTFRSIPGATSSAPAA